MICSLLAHSILLGIDFRSPASVMDNQEPELKVIIVNHKSSIAPVEVKTLSQLTLNGGGNTEKNIQSETNLPEFDRATHDSIEFSRQRIASLEKRAKKLMATVEGMVASAQLNKTLPELETGAESENSSSAGKQLKIAELKTKITKDWVEYQKMPKRDFIGAQTKGVVYAEYVDKWREKIEEVGTRNFPKVTGADSLYGSLVVTVSIRSDGTLEAVELVGTSGIAVLDQAVTKIVKLSSPFPPFSSEMSEAIDILSITRNWSFTRSDLLVTDGI